LGGSAVVTKEGRRKMLLVNKHNRNFDVTIAGAFGGHLDYIDVTQVSATYFYKIKVGQHGFSVAVLNLS
jgi:hypothetical protein